MSAAAFFDLDRTLLPESSSPIFARYLGAEGLGVGADVPGQDLALGFYNRFGETWLNMQVTKQLVRAAKGWPVDAVKRAAEAAADEVAAAIPGFALQLIEELRADGVRLVIATTSPTVLVGPLAERLGFDDVIGTVWADDGEAFTGDTIGPFIWGPEKRDAIVDWAEDRGVSLADSSAYSDSYYDGSMLDAVGHPVAVNRDARLLGVAVLKGWQIRSFEAPPGVLKMGGIELQDWLRPFSRPEFFRLAHWAIEGDELVPAEGPVILAFNHRSYFDTVAMSLLIAKIGRPARFLAKKEMFDMPIIGPIAKIIGGIKVDRGSGSDEPLRYAVEALEAGEMVALAPQGTIPRGQDFFDPALKGRPGVANLAKRSGAEVYPVGLWGTEKVWPRNQKLPNLNPLDRPPVSVKVGPPVHQVGRSANADTKRIMTAISELLPEEAHRRHKPTPDELARTFPPGHAEAKA